MSPIWCAMSLTGAIETWIMVGLPEEKLVRRACGRAAQVRIYAYGGDSGPTSGWNQNATALARCSNLSVWSLPMAQTAALAALASRAMALTVTVQDGEVLLACDAGSVTIEPLVRLLAA
jgi:uncharacterized protein YaeQ